MSIVQALKTISKGTDEVAQAGVKAAAKVRKVPDTSRGFNLRLPDGTVIPFKAGKDLEQAKTWTRNFYRKDFDFVQPKKAKAEDSEPSFGIIRDKKDPGNMIRFTDLETTWQVQTAKVGEAYRGQGIGAGMYRTLFEKAKQKGVTVTSDSRLSESSFAIWQRFKQLGYPIKERPYKKIGSHYELADKDLMKSPEEQGGIFEYDPLASDVPNLIKPQAGQTEADKFGTKTDMLIEKQAE